MCWQACSRHSSHAHIASGFYLAWMWTASDFKRNSPCLKQVQADQPQEKDRKRNENVRNHLELVAWQNMPGSWSHGCVVAPGVPIVEGWTSPHLLHQRKHSSWRTLTLSGCHIWCYPGRIWHRSLLTAHSLIFLKTWPGQYINIWSVDAMWFEADSARHVVAMGQLFSNMQLPGGGQVLSVLAGHIYGMHVFQFHCLHVVVERMSCEVTATCCQQRKVGLAKRIGRETCIHWSTSSTWHYRYDLSMWTYLFAGTMNTTCFLGQPCLFHHGWRLSFRRHPGNPSLVEKLSVMKRHGDTCSKTSGAPSKLPGGMGMKFSKTALRNLIVGARWWRPW